jgi:hypothetical protein
MIAYFQGVLLFLSAAAVMAASDRIAAGYLRLKAGRKQGGE